MQRITEGSIFLLLWTSVVGQILQAGEVAAAALALQGVAPPPAPLLMGGLTCALALPWCFVREMKQVRSLHVAPIHTGGILHPLPDDPPTGSLIACLSNDLHTPPPPPALSCFVLLLL